MSAKSWAGELGEPVAEEASEDGSYKAWRPSSGGFVRDLKLVPAPASGELVRFIPYMQAITLELSLDGAQLALICHTSGHLIFLQGSGLDELAEQISAKRAQSIHVHDAQVHGDKPACVVTGLTVERPETP